MDLIVYGTNHKTAPVEVRERMAFGSDETRAFLANPIHPAIEAVLLSTCNRTELYAVTSRATDAAETLASRLDAAKHAPRRRATRRACAARYRSGPRPRGHRANVAPLVFPMRLL